MISVELLVTEIGRLSVPAGRIDFYALPVQKEGDFVSVPSGIASLAEAESISAQLAQQIVQRKVGRYDWRKISSSV